MKQPRVLVVGSINMDLTVYGTPRAAEYGEVLRCRSYAYAPGGKGANQACAFARLGAECTIAGCVGDDQNGDRIISAFTQYGVDQSFVTRIEDGQTGVVLLLTETDGRYYGYSVLGANLELNEEKVKKALDAKSYDMVALQLEIPLETAYRTYELCKDRSIPVMLDPGPAMSISLERFYGVEVLTPNEAETKALTGIAINNEQDAYRAVESLYDQAKPHYIVLKLGEKGVFCFDGKTARSIPAFPVAAQDSTAAGDTFNSALCIGLCTGQDFWQAVDFAQAAAAITVTRKGAIDSIPSLDDVQRFFKQNADKR